jgi:tetratricopeptide (TPR) repeat protein
VNRFSAEELRLAEVEAASGGKLDYEHPNLWVETDYTFGGSMDPHASNAGVTIGPDPDYPTQMHYAKQTPCLLKAEPDNRDARMGLVDLWLSMGRYADAESALKDALKTDENDVQALARLGILKSRMGRPNEALEPLEKVANSNPLMYEARAEYAFLLFRGDPSNADRCIATMTDILTSEPRQVLALHYLGMCLYAQGKKPRAEESFKAALAVDPGFAAAQFSLGELYENDGKKDLAKKSYEAAAAAGHSEANGAIKRLAGGK